MAVNNVNHAGRRIYCGRRKEGGRCANGKLEPIEQRVVVALKRQLADPRAIERYLRTYRAERKRLAAQSASTRSKLERQLAHAKREIDRVVDGIARGTLSDDEAQARLKEPRRLRDQAQVELAAIALMPKVVELHPGAIARYLATVENLADTLARRVVKADEDVAAALRELISAVIVHPSEKQEPRLEVKGCLAQLTGTSTLFPQQTIPPTG